MIDVYPLTEYQEEQLNMIGEDPELPMILPEIQEGDSVVAVKRLTEKLIGAKELITLGIIEDKTEDMAEMVMTLHAKFGRRIRLYFLTNLGKIMFAPLKTKHIN